MTNTTETAVAALGNATTAQKKLIDNAVANWLELDNWVGDCPAFFDLPESVFERMGDFEMGLVGALDDVLGEGYSEGFADETESQLLDVLFLLGLIDAGKTRIPLVADTEGAGH